MKLKQLEYAIKVANSGSFSQAAKELYTSQPNISATINSLEEELGYKIFHRTNQGITLTKKGITFLSYAKNIYEELDKINEIKDSDVYKKISIGCTFDLITVSEAFVEFCAAHQDTPSINFKLYNGSSIDIIDDIYNRRTQLGILSINKIVLDSYINTMGNRNLQFDVIKDLDLNVHLRIGHPLLQEESFDFAKLSNYPLVVFNFNVKSNYTIATEFHDILSKGFINIDKMITIDHRDTRDKLVQKSNAFTVEVEKHPKMEPKNQTTVIPIPDAKMAIVFVRKKNEPLTKEIVAFIELFKKELTNLLGY